MMSVNIPKPSSGFIHNKFAYVLRILIVYNLDTKFSATVKTIRNQTTLLAIYDKLYIMSFTINFCILNFCITFLKK